MIVIPNKVSAISSLGRYTIEDYDIDIVVNKNNTFDITEKIEIHSDKQVDIYFNFKLLQELNIKLNSFCVVRKEYEKRDKKL